ncbi:AAA family ATPase [Sutcliffiella cohnii]
MKRISLVKLTLTNFKNHESLEINFKDINYINGGNGAGKSSIGDATTWCLFGKDVFGSKLEPQPIDTDLETKVELLIQVDENQYLIGRSQKKATKLYINEVPQKKATKFNEFISGLFDEKLFFSLFTPAYFFTLHWQEQRAQLLQFVKEPLNKEVLAEMSNLMKETLEGPLKKHSIDDLEEQHKDKKKLNESLYERAAERFLTLQEQLQKTTVEEFDEVAVREKIEILSAKRKSLEDEIDNWYKKKQARNRIENQIDSLLDQIERQKSVVNRIKNEEIKEECSTCGQALDEESINKVKENRQARFNKEVMAGKELVSRLNELKKSLESMPSPEEVDRTELSEVDEEIVNLQIKLRSVGKVEQLKKEVLEAEENKEKLRKEKNASVAIIDAIKKFRTVKSELMVKKVDNLFTKITVKLYEQLKNGDEKATFEIEMDGKPYSKLSTAEKIKAGLELIEVLSTQSEVIAPCFVDNAESILHFTSPPGQLIVARVVDEEFNIKTVSLEGEKDA